MPPKAAKIEIPEAGNAGDYVVSVTSTAPRRRAGHSFGPAPKHLTREQLTQKLDDGTTVIEALEADPLIILRAYKAEPQADVQADNE